MKKSIFLFFAAILCATNAWSIGFNKGNVIFRAQGWNSPAHVYLCVGHDNYTQVWEMGKIPNTDLYHVWVNVDNNDNNWWNGCTYFAVIGSSNTVTNGFKKSELSTKGNKGYTAAYTNAYDIDNKDGIYFFNKNNSTVNGGSFSIDWCGSYSDIAQLEAKQAAKVRNSKADAYTDIDTWPATLALKGTYLSGNTASGSSEITGTKSSDGNTYNTVVTGKVTHTYANLSEDYHFEGWGTADAPTSAVASYDYYITENTTVYAFFTKKYPVNFSADANGSVTATADEQALTSGNKVVGGTEVTLTATANPGYKFVNWTKAGVEVSTDATYSFTATENVELVANFVKTATVTLVDAGELGATLTGAGEYAASSSVTVTASHSDADWVFAYWKHQDGEIASYDAEYTFTLGAEDVVLEAYFAMGGMESDMNDLVIDTETFAGTYMAVLTGSDASNGIEAMLAVSENIAGDLYKLGAAEVSFGGSSLDFVSGTVTIDMEAPSAIADVIVSFGGELMAIRMNMSATGAAPVDVMVADATVTYSDNDGALKFNGTDVYSSDAVYVELSGFEYNGVGSNTLSVAQISMFENSTAFAFADEVVVTVEADGTVAVEGTYTSMADGSVYNVTIWGALPTYNVTLVSNPDEIGATLTGAGTYYPTQEVTVSATHSDADWVFAYWKHQDGEIASYDAEYTFTLGAEDVVLEAYFAMGGMESDMNDLVIDTETFAGTYMAVLTGSDASNGIEAMLAVSENIAGDLYKLGAAEVSFGGSSLDFVSGTVTIDMEAPSAIADVIVSFGGELMAIRMNMSATGAAPVDVMVADATVTYSDNDGALKFNGTDVYSSDAVYVELSGFEYNGVGSNTLSVAQISMFENSTAFAFADEVVVTVEADGTVAVEGTYTSMADGSVYNVTIWGALPTYNVTLVSNPDEIGATLTGAGTYYPTQEVTVSAAQELTGYEFENWTNGDDEVVSTDATYTFRLGYDLVLVANYTEATTPTTPNYTRNVTAGNFGTICLPFGSTNFTGAELFECVGSEPGKVYIASVTTLKAGVPYIFLATATELAVYSDGTTAATAGNSNGLYGTFDNETVVAAGNYILKNNELRESDGNAKVNANRAYLVMNEVPVGAPQQMPGRRYIGMSTKGENAATGLDNITNGENVVKTIVNGQLVITIDGVQYNAQGIKF